MPAKAWSARRELPYRHMRQGLLDSDRPPDEAEEIAARTVNKERARHGEAAEASALSLSDISSSRRGGLRSHRGAGGRAYRRLHAEAAKQGIAGRSAMNKAQLEKAGGR